MALSPETPVLEFLGNGSATVFEHVPHFTLSDPSHLSVSVDGVVIESGFTQTATGIEFDVAPVADTSIILRRTTPLDQPLTTDGLRTFALENIAAGFDRIVRALQDRLANNDDPGAFTRALTFDRYEPSDFATQLDLPHLRKDTVLYFDPATGEMQVLRIDQLAQRMLVILGAEAVLPYRVREINISSMLEAEDSNSFLRCNAAWENPIVITLPTTADTGIDDTFSVEVSRIGDATVEFLAADGVVLESDSGKYRIFGQFTSVAVRCVGTNRWQIYGDIY